MLSTFANGTSSSSSSTSSYETPPSWWKFNFTANLYAAFATILFPSTVPSSQESLMSSISEKYTDTIDHCRQSYTNGFHRHDNTKPLRILLFSESFPSFTSGITRRFQEILFRLASKNHHIHVVTGCTNAFNWSQTSDILKQNVTFSILRSTEFTDKIDCAYPFLFPSPFIYTEIRKYAPDVVHIVEQTPSAMLCGVYAHSLGIPIVWSSHTNIDFYLSTYIRPFAVSWSRNLYQIIRRNHLSYSTVNLTVSKDFAAFMEKTGTPKPVVVWKTGVDSELFNPRRRSREMRYRMFGTHNRFTEAQMDSITLFLCVGRISPEKNFEFLSILLGNVKSPTFLCIVGDGPYRKTLEPLFPKDRVYFLGYLGGEELASAYASADYFIYASVSETFGQVYLESMASGTPVIAAEGGQLKEFFLNGEHGYLWEPDNLISARNAVEAAMKNRQYLSEKARQQALLHSWDAASEQINDIYHDAVKRSKNRMKYQTTSVFKHIGQLFYYGLKWVILMLLALFFMAPFVKVLPPETKITKSYDKNNNNTNKIEHYNENSSVKR